MPDSHRLMLNLGWEDLWRLSAQGMTQHLVQGCSGFPGEPGIRKQEFCVQGTMGGGTQCCALGGKVGISHWLDSVILEVFSNPQ